MNCVPVHNSPLPLGAGLADAAGLDALTKSRPASGSPRAGTRRERGESNDWLPSATGAGAWEARELGAQA